MTSETVKALLMLAAFGALEAALHLSDVFRSATWNRVRRTVISRVGSLNLHWHRRRSPAPISRPPGPTAQAR